MANMYPSELGGGGAGGTPPATKGHSIEGQDFSVSSNYVACGNAAKLFLVNIEGCTNVKFKSLPTASQADVRYRILFEDGTQGSVQIPTSGSTYALPSNGKWLCLATFSSSGGYSAYVQVY